MGTNRTPISRRPHGRVTPEAVALFKKIRALAGDDAKHDERVKAHHALDALLGRNAGDADIMFCNTPTPGAATCRTMITIAKAMRSISNSPPVPPRQQMQPPTEQDRDRAKLVLDHLDRLRVLGGFAGEDVRQVEVNFAAMMLRNTRLGLNDQKEDTDHV
jgi:hypothetical protein